MSNSTLRSPAWVSSSYDEKCHRNREQDGVVMEMKIKVQATLIFFNNVHTILFKR